MYERSKLAEAKTQRELKEMLYNDAIELFEKGKIWEEGVKLCKELERQYESETFQYAELAKLLVSSRIVLLTTKIFYLSDMKLCLK